MQSRNWAGMATAALAVTALATPAQAQRWGGGHHRYHDHDHVSLGDALLGVLLVGTVAAAVDRHEREREPEVVYINPPPDPQAPEPQADVHDAGPPQPQGGGFDGVYDEESAADTCAQATQFTGQRYAKIAQIMGIDDVSGKAKDWLVRGHVELADTWRSPRKGYDFRCTLSGGKEPEVVIEGLAAR
jgi:hypothetical protein